MSDDSRLEEQFFPTSEALWRRWLPWLTMVRGFRMAIEFRSMFVALIAVCVWYLGDVALTSLIPRSSQSRREVIRLDTPAGELTARMMLSPPLTSYVGPPWESGSLPHAPATRTRIDFLSILSSPLKTLTAAFSNGNAILWPMQRLTAQVLEVWEQDQTLGERFGALLSLVWSILVLGWFGGMISRMAAVEFAKREEVSVRQAMSFATRRLPSILGAPLITLVGMAFFAIPIGLAGLVMELPGVGDLPVAVLWFLVIAAGFFLSLILIAVLASWPLMTAAVSADGGDAFDGLSRSFSYLFNRPWYGLFLAILALLYGSVSIYFVTGMMTLAVDVTASTLELGLRDVRLEQVFASVPAHPAILPWQGVEDGSVDPILGPARTTIGLWMRLVLAVPAAFLFSYFWCAVTIIYFLLRRREDATPLDEIGDTPSRPSKSGSLPLVGTAAVRQREATSDHSGTPDESCDDTPAS